jgi:phospholipid/cholesterol/gamma-HCH transport system substrate-binding protein
MVKVGGVVISATLVLALVIYYFLGPAKAGKTWSMEIIFKDARGLVGGEPVRMAGVQIGVVKEVSLTADGQASVRVLIKKDVHLYQNYLFTVSTGALVPERFVEVQSVPADIASEELGEGAVVQGQERPGLPELMAAAHATLKQLEETSASVNALVRNPSLEKALAQFEITAHEAAVMMGNLESLTAEARPHLAEAARQVAAASEEMQKAVSHLSAKIRESSAPEEIEAAAVAARKAAEDAQVTAASMKALLSDPTWQSDFRGGLADFRKMMENLSQASEDVRAVTGEVKESAPKIRSVVERADALMEDVGQWSERLKPPQIRPEFDFLSSSRAGRSFTDARFDISFAGQNSRFLRLGVSDIGEQNQVNFQAGRRLGGRDLRYGLVRSKLGVGADLEMPGGGQLSLDILDPNRLRADFTAEYPLGGERGWGLIFGVRDGFGEDLGFVGGRFGK